MTIYLRTQYTIYCDGAVHMPLEGSTGSDNPTADAKALLRSAGWVQKRDGRTICPKHQKEARR